MEENLRNKLRISVLFNIALFINVLILAFFYMNKVNTYNILSNDSKQQIEVLENTLNTIDSKYNSIIENKDNYIEALETNYEDLYALSTDANQYNIKLLEDNDYLHNVNKNLLSENEDLSSRLNTYETYKVFMYTDNYSGKRTDCDYETLMYLQSLIEDKAINNLAFYCSWIMIESTWNNHDKNDTSGANGLPQFLPSTGQWIYAEIGGNPDEYIHDEYVTKSEISLPMMVKYLDILCIQYDGDLPKIIDCYRGFHDTAYLNRFNSYLAMFDTSIEKEALLVKERWNAMQKPLG